MASVNKVIIIGNLGADPEIRRFDNGGMIATLSVATSERWTDKQTGELKEHTEWHRIVFNNRLAEIVERYLKKGAPVYVEGVLRTRKWTDQTGQDRYSTEIRADNMQMLGASNRMDDDSRSNYSGAGSYAQNKKDANKQPLQDTYASKSTSNMFGSAASKDNGGYGQVNHTANEEQDKSRSTLRPAKDVNDDDMPF